ncbi:E3 ubiquitin-protein ligase TRIM71-like [Mercenaria mercenaria]|uniref:E3 ubiquitin-protein ligase TRIM71-like n=1 Tax=Mercenaria mercenaria TaxID=6596 RepID=UPI00234F5E4C|nr:E3 ubiquitin-protein ligase TRIM71-like [Mercenaria mercenaria]
MATSRDFSFSQTSASDEVHDFSCNPCAKEGKNTEALFQCTDCYIFFCHRCVSGHNKFTENHNVVDRSSNNFGKGQRTPRPFTPLDLPTDFCDEHDGELIRMFCVKHEVVCCTICVTVKHRSCVGVEYIPNIAKGYLKRLNKDQTITSLEKVKYDLQKLKLKAHNDSKELSKQRDGILDDIQKFKKSLTKRIRELEKKSIKEVQDHYNKIADDINADRKKIDDILKCVEKRLDKLRQSRTNNDAETFVNIKYGEMKVSDGNACVQTTLARKPEKLAFELNKDIEKYLHETHSLGTPTAKTQTDAAGPVQTASRTDRSKKTADQQPCPSCGDIVKPEYMQEHMKIHCAKKEFICSNCGEGFDTELDCMIHDIDCEMGGSFEDDVYNSYRLIPNEPSYGFECFVK